MLRTLSLEGKVAVITGATRGIGRAVAVAFLKAGADIGVNYNRTPADDLVELAESMGRRCYAVPANVSQVSDCERLVNETAKELGKVDILVNNAGITRDGLLMRMDEEQWNAVIETNLRSVYACSKAAVKLMMKARCGSIINITSVSGLMGLAGQTNYSASKAGVIGFSKALAREVASRNIRVNCIAPGYIVSDMTNVLPEAVRETAKQNIPLQRFGTGDDVANAVLFLASPLAEYITGEILRVDGGMAI